MNSLWSAALTAFALVVVLGQSDPAAQTDLTPHRLGRVDAGCVSIPEFGPSEASTEWRGSIRRSGALFWIVHVTAAQSGTGQWQLRVFNPGSSIAVGEVASTALQTGGDWWSPELANGATIQITGDLRGLHLNVPECVVGDAEARLKSIIGTNDLKHIGEYRNEALYHWGRSVARLKVLDNLGYFTCTSFLVAADLLLTNEHCTTRAWKRMTAEFNAERGNLGERDDVAVTEIVRVDPVLDVAMLKLAAPTTYPVVRFASQNVSRDASVSLVVIQHPSGEDKQVTRDNCQSAIWTTIVTQFAHVCDTEKGSSGSPVFTSDGLVVGLHRKGFRQGAKSARNEAIVMTELIKFIEAAGEK